MGLDDTERHEQRTVRVRGRSRSMTTALGESHCTRLRGLQAR